MERNRPEESLGIQEAVEALVKCFESNKSVLLTGAPGAGKTVSAGLAAEALGYGYRILNLSVADPSDIKGLPFVHDGSGVWVTLPNFQVLWDDHERPVVVNFDDVSQAEMGVKNAIYGILDARVRGIDGARLSDNVRLVATGNRREDASGVSGMPSALLERFDVILPVQVGVDEWIGWAQSQGLNPVTLAYLKNRPAHFLSETRNTNMEGGPSPRVWEQVAWATTNLRESLSRAAFRSMLQAKLGVSIGADYSSTLTVLEELPSLDEILVGSHAVLARRLEGRGDVSMLLAGSLPRMMRDLEGDGMISGKKVETVLEFVEALASEAGAFEAEVVMAFYKSATKLLEVQFTTSKEWNSWVTKHREQLTYSQAAA